MMKYFRFTICIALILAPLFTHAQLNQDAMPDDEIFAFLSGNTIGAHDWNTDGTFSYEYHGINGEAIWREGEDILVGQYRIENSSVCYTYEESELEDWFCWEFKRDRRTGDVYQWADYGDYYRLYIFGAGDLVSDPDLAE